MNQRVKKKSRIKELEIKVERLEEAMGYVVEDLLELQKPHRQKVSEFYCAKRDEEQAAEAVSEAMKKQGW